MVHFMLCMFVKYTHKEQAVGRMFVRTGQAGAVEEEAFEGCHGDDAV